MMTVTAPVSRDFLLDFYSQFYELVAAGNHVTTSVYQAIARLRNNSKLVQIFQYFVFDSKVGDFCGS